MPPPRTLTLQEAADILGVHYMTAYRYVRHGRLPARKEGGTWVIDESDLDALQVEPVVPARKRKAPWKERLEVTLLSGDEAGAWGVVEAAMAAGREPGQVYVELLGPALASIGGRWAAGEVDIAEEHRASAVAGRIIGRLGPAFARRGRAKGTVVVATPPGERHGLGSAMVADLLRGQGYEVVDLGTDVPVDSLLHTLETSDRVLCVCIGVASSDNLPAATEVVAAVHEMGVLPVVVGGPAISDETLFRAIGADHWAADGAGLVRLVDGLLAQRVQRPQPG
jgi:excisionase family DNA binding protein